MVLFFVVVKSKSFVCSFILCVWKCQLEYLIGVHAQQLSIICIAEIVWSIIMAYGWIVNPESHTIISFADDETFVVHENMSNVHVDLNLDHLISLLTCVYYVHIFVCFLHNRLIKMVQFHWNECLHRWQRYEIEKINSIQWQMYQHCYYIHFKLAHLLIK